MSAGGIRCVSYARVSTAREDQAESLQTQERAFTRWVEETGATRAASYIERASGGSVEGRAEFQRMIRDLTRLKVNVVIVDTLDRWTRNLRDGLNILEELRGHGVGLLPLDWRRAQPIRVDDDSDWRDVVEEFTGAERERRRIRRRVVKGYDARRDRGATTANRVAFGLRKEGDRLAPDPETAWIVQEADRRLLAGDSSQDVALWTRPIHPKAWKTRSGVMRSAANRSYVVAGVRTTETQKLLDGLLAQHRVRFGSQVKRRYEHEFTGVFKCARCGKFMGGFFVGRPNRKHGVICQTIDRADGGHSLFVVSSVKFRERWERYIGDLSQLTAAAVQQWASGEAAEGADRARGLQRSLTALERRGEALKARRDAAFDLLADKSAALKAQARKQLVDVNTDEAKIDLQRQAILAELAAERPPERNPEELLAAIRAFAKVYQHASPRVRNQLNRALCVAVGGHPTLNRESGRRDRHAPATVSWPQADALLRPTKRNPRPKARRA